MSDDSDKTEEPTDHKLRKAKEEGNVPRSEDLNGFIGIVFVLLLLGVFYLMYPKRVSDEMGKCFQTMWSLALDKYSMTPECLTLVNTAVEMTYISFFAMIIAAFLAYFIMNKGFVIPKEPIKFNMQALDIGTNFTNLFNMQNVVGLAMSVFKEILFYGTLFLLVQYFLGGIVYETFCFENCSGVSAIYYILALILAYTLISFIFAAVDYPMKIHFWRDKLKMSHKDLKDEHKEMEGSPEIKHAQQDFRWEMMNGVPSGPKNATFFVGNGTTIWGIRYNREESPAPIIVAVGKKPEQVGSIARTAQQMRRLIIADDEFCRLLSGKAVMGRPVPLEYIAQVRRAIMELRKWEGQFGPVHPPKK